VHHGSAAIVVGAARAVAFGDFAFLFKGNLKWRD
jgi:hypothetical protein